jgi:hypothetical protein
MKLGYSVLLIVIVSATAYCQDIASVNTTWTSVETLMVTTGDRTTATTRLTSCKKDHLVWADSPLTCELTITTAEAQ